MLATALASYAISAPGSRISLVPNIKAALHMHELVRAAGASSAAVLKYDARLGLCFAVLDAELSESADIGAMLLHKFLEVASTCAT